MKKLLSVLLCFSLSFPAMGRDKGITGNEWRMQSIDGTPTLGAMAYLAGIYSQHNLSGAGLECIKYSEGVTVGDASRILQKYMDDEPYVIHQPLTLIYHVAMTDAFGTKPLSEDGFCD